MGLIELFEKGQQKAKDRDALAVKLITVNTYDDDTLVSFFDRFYPEAEVRKNFLKKYFSIIYPLYRSPLLAAIFGISSAALRKMASRHNVRKAENWTSEEDEFLKNNYKSMSNKELQAHLGRTKWAVISRYQILTGKK
ncbi:hypothetical protein [Olivibacter sitiensis]|uniref:hypothetical protein n=1 Tax=Olivibacter sitiensis TaxID=376470 RepID=UPI00042756EE|nr:hypothetical protein [Olivibacter sitiensis]